MNNTPLTRELFLTKIKLEKVVDQLEQSESRAFLNYGIAHYELDDYKMADALLEEVRSLREDADHMVYQIAHLEQLLTVTPEENHLAHVERHSRCNLCEEGEL